MTTKRKTKAKPFNAKEALAARLEGSALLHTRDDSEIAQLTEDLLEWFNVTIEGVDREDVERLAVLAEEGRFKAWDCPTCEPSVTRVFESDPEDWDHFQGVCENDRVSYPGAGPSDKRCDHCRCYNLGDHCQGCRCFGHDDE